MPGFSGVYGLQKLLQTPVVLLLLPHALTSVHALREDGSHAPAAVSALIAWRELSLGKLKLLIDAQIVGDCRDRVRHVRPGGSPDKCMVYNHLFAVFAALVLLTVVLVPSFSKLLVIANHRTVTAATLIFALAVCYTNLSSLMHYRVVQLMDSLVFGALLFALGYLTLEIMFTNERPLLSIETELETARQI